MRPDRSILVLALPALAFFAVFSYGPMVGAIVAFKDFNVVEGIFGSPWNGLENFRFFFESGNAGRVIRNTLILNALFIGGTITAGMAMAVMINEIRFRLLKRTAQSVIFLPYFISPIVISVMLQAFLSGFGGSGGVVNNMLGGLGISPVSWYTEPGAWPWILTIVKIWQLAGYTSIIYLAAMTAIPPDVYEAAVLDGASRWKIALRVTVPLIMPVTVILLILQVGRIFMGDFGTIYAIIGDNGTLFPTTDVIDTYVFRALRTSGNLGMTAAVGLFQSVVGFILIAATALIARRVSRKSGGF
ncbi:ABC transporter permease [Bogoriella caseilytica]|uniref:Carbohydrate ABC transporter membrane protein 1 (CUT1 family) n=1 Tax=Bogoriella caseilytica TaxID=56055 RepID=A0A3N2BDX0_9MICO|nr:ABC transporter permease subunit [Bogoriella caseilytica]ROR73442.1 carbohydrate ABC transporter membrane protein 1 (CUT1 family) [Bogoriella caseilytica]